MTVSMAGRDVGFQGRVGHEDHREVAVGRGHPPCGEMLPGQGCGHRTRGRGAELLLHHRDQTSCNGLGPRLRPVAARGQDLSRRIDEHRSIRRGQRQARVRDLVPGRLRLDLGLEVPLRPRPSRPRVLPGRTTRSPLQALPRGGLPATRRIQAPPGRRAPKSQEALQAPQARRPRRRRPLRPGPARRSTRPRKIRSRGRSRPAGAARTCPRPRLTRRAPVRTFPCRPHGPRRAREGGGSSSSIGTSGSKSGSGGGGGSGSEESSSRPCSSASSEASIARGSGSGAASSGTAVWNSEGSSSGGSGFNSGASSSGGSGSSFGSVRSRAGGAGDAAGSGGGGVGTGAGGAGATGVGLRATSVPRARWWRRWARPRATSRSEELAGGLSFMHLLLAEEAVHPSLQLVGQQLEAASFRAAGPVAQESHRVPRALARAKASVRGITVSSVSGKPFHISLNTAWVPCRSRSTRLGRMPRSRSRGLASD